MDETYIPYNLYLELYTNKNWDKVELNLSSIDLAKKGVITWSNNNIKGRWTMKTPNTYLFEDGEDALVFKFKFGTK